jgi:hypothetical protein
MENVATYSEARSEYTKQLATFIVPVLVGWFQQTWHRNAHNRQQCLALFQSECEEVARWNADRIHDEVRVLIEKTGCDYMEELMTAVFVAHTKVLTAVRLSSREKKLSITVPKLDHFIHRIFREAARVFWKSPFLFMDGGSVVERQKNVLQIEALATEAIGTAVRSLLPVKQILKDYLDGDHEEIEDETVPVAAHALAEEEEKAPVSDVPRLEVTEMSPAPVPSVASPTAPVGVSTTNSSTASSDNVAVGGSTTNSSKASNSSAVVASIASSSPSVVNIDTEPAVKFAAYDDVYDEAADGPTLRPTRDGDGDEDLALEEGSLHIDEASATDLAADSDIMDIDAPLPPAPKAAAPLMSDKIREDEVVDL